MPGDCKGGIIILRDDVVDEDVTEFKALIDELAEYIETSDRLEVVWLRS